MVETALFDLAPYTEATPAGRPDWAYENADAVEDDPQRRTPSVPAIAETPPEVWRQKDSLMLVSPEQAIVPSWQHYYFRVDTLPVYEQIELSDEHIKKVRKVQGQYFQKQKKLKSTGSRFKELQQAIDELEAIVQQELNLSVRFRHEDHRGWVAKYHLLPDEIEVTVLEPNGREYTKLVASDKSPIAARKMFTEAVNEGCQRRSITNNSVTPTPDPVTESRLIQVESPTHIYQTLIIEDPGNNRTGYRTTVIDKRSTVDGKPSSSSDTDDSVTPIQPPVTESMPGAEECEHDACLDTNDSVTPIHHPVTESSNVLLFRLRSSEQQHDLLLNELMQVKSELAHLKNQFHNEDSVMNAGRDCDIRREKKAYKGWRGEFLQLYCEEIKIRIFDADGQIQSTIWSHSNNWDEAYQLFVKVADKCIEKLSQSLIDVCPDTNDSVTPIRHPVTESTPGAEECDRDVCPDTNDSVTPIHHPVTESFRGCVVTYKAKGTARESMTTHYYRYSWREKGRVKHCHIPGGNTDNPIAKRRVEQVVEAIAQGNSPAAIVHLIRSWGRSKKSETLIKQAA